MELSKLVKTPLSQTKYPTTQLSRTKNPLLLHQTSPNYPLPPKTHLAITNLKAESPNATTTSSSKISGAKINHGTNYVPTMSEIMESSRLQNLDLQLQRFGPFFRITAKSLESGKELGRAEGVIRVWFGGKLMHLDSMKLQRETIGMKKSIFGIGLFIGAVAIRFGYDCGCLKAELLAINDSPLYHSKLVRFYKRLGFRQVYEVEGGSLRDLSDMLIWGGVGTRMDANIQDLMTKWCSRFKRP